MSAASKEAVMHHTLAKQKKDDQQDEGKHQLSDSERSLPWSRGVRLLRIRCHARPPILLATMLFQDEAARQIRQALDAVLRAPILKFVHDLFSGDRIPVAGSSDLHGSGARQHELDNV